MTLGQEVRKPAVRTSSQEFTACVFSPLSPSRALLQKGSLLSGEWVVEGLQLLQHGNSRTDWHGRTSVRSAPALEPSSDIPWPWALGDGSLWHPGFKSSCFWNCGPDMCGELLVWLETCEGDREESNGSLKLDGKDYRKSSQVTKQRNNSHLPKLFLTQSLTWVFQSK
jgi:hypothetical protein